MAKMFVESEVNHSLVQKEIISLVYFNSRCTTCSDLFSVFTITRKFEELIALMVVVHQLEQIFV